MAYLISHSPQAVRLDETLTRFITPRPSPLSLYSTPLRSLRLVIRLARIQSPSKPAQSLHQVVVPATAVP